jgi:hypothetical protein
VGKESRMSITYRGMNVSEPDVTTPEELEAFLTFSDQPTGRPLASYALWADLRPDVLKRLLNYVHQIHASETFSCPLPYLNIYTVGGWGEGAEYILNLCSPGTFMTGVGYSRDAIIETLALSFYLAPTWGTVIVADTLRNALAGYEEPEPDSPSPYPEEWRVAPDELKAGLDYSTPDLTEADIKALTDWYLRVCGEVPASIKLYARYRPQLLKAERNRWENIVRRGLPNQMFAFLLIHYEVWRQNAAGTRDALLLARGLGMSKEHAVDAVWYGGSFLGGTGTIGAVAEPVEEILEAW